jgi:hypothetical protein
MMLLHGLIIVLTLIIYSTNAQIYSTVCKAGCRPVSSFPNVSAPFCANYIDTRDNLCYLSSSVSILDSEVASLYAQTYQADVLGGAAVAKNAPNLYDINACVNAAKRFLCAHYFPRCTNSGSNSTAMGICSSLCENYYNTCNSADLISFRCGSSAVDQWNSSYPSGLYSGSYPSDPCTGTATLISWSLRMFVVLIIATVLLL